MPALPAAPVGICNESHEHKVYKQKILKPLSNDQLRYFGDEITAPACWNFGKGVGPGMSQRPNKEHSPTRNHRRYAESTVFTQYLLLYLCLSVLADLSKPGQVTFALDC